MEKSNFTYSNKGELPLIGACVLYIAAKYEEIYPPKASRIFNLFIDEKDNNDENYNKPTNHEKFIKLEYKMHLTLGFDYMFVSPFTYLPRIMFLFKKQLNQLKINEEGMNKENVTKKLFYLTMFILELNLLEYKMLQYDSSVLVVAAFYLSNKILPLSVIKLKDKTYKNIVNTIGEELNVSLLEIRNCVKELCSVLVNNHKFKDLFIMDNKFYKEDFLHVAKDCNDKLKSLNIIS